MTNGAVANTDPPRVSGVDEISTQPDRRAQRRAHRQAQSRQNRVDILDAAEKIFGERGIHNGSLREIARFVSEKLSTVEGVVSTATRFRLKTYKQNGMLLSQPVSAERLQVTP